MADISRFEGRLRYPRGSMRYRAVPLVLTTIALGATVGGANVHQAPTVKAVTKELGSETPAANRSARRDVWADDYRCRVPEVPVEAAGGCAHNHRYPDCKWRVVAPARAGHLYRIWRNTRPEHRSGSPGLVSLVLAAAADYSRRYPGEVLVIGDLDAPGPRHRTHRKGQDVDLYLPGTMIAENVSGGEYPSNYLYADSLERTMLRSRVETLAKILATCSRGQVRIYYNDAPVNRRFGSWFLDRGLASPFGPPIRHHNDLHRFHFHVTVPENFVPLEGDHHLVPIDD